MATSKNITKSKSFILNKNKPKHFLSIILIVVVGFIIYSNTIDSAFHLDDYHAIVDNSFIKSLDNFSDVSYWSKIINNRPFSYYTFALNYYNDDLNLSGYHILNISIHLFTALAVYWLVLLIFSTQVFQRQKILTYKNFIALFTALIFIAHPIQTQGVTYIVQRMTSMAGLFYILSLCFYLKARLVHLQNDLNAKAILNYSVSLLTFVPAIMSKEIAFSLPLIIILFELYFIRNKSKKISWKYLFVFSSVIILAAIIRILISGLPRETLEISRFEYLITQFKVIIIYLKLLLIPIDQKVFYDLTLSTNLLDLWTLFSFMSIIFILFIGFYFYKREKIISFCIFWFFITLSIESSIFPIRDIIFEHRLYLPLFGFAFLTTYLLFKFFAENRSRQLFIFFTILIVIYSLMTYARNSVWQSEESLWTDNIEKTPNNARAYYSRANAYARFGPVDKSIPDYTKAIELNPTNALYLNDRGFAYNRLGNYNYAKNDFQNSIRLKPDLDAAYFNLGITYFQLNNFDAAVNSFTKAIEINPNYYQAFIERGNVYSVTGKFNNAISDYSNAIRLKKNSEDAYYNRGNVHNVTGSYELAIKDFKEVLKLNPQNIKAYKNRASAFYQIKKYEYAINDYTIILNLNPNDGESYYYRALCLYKINKFSEGYEDLKNAEKTGFKISKKIYAKFEGKMIKK